MSLVCICVCVMVVLLVNVGVVMVDEIVMRRVVISWIFIFFILMEKELGIWEGGVWLFDVMFR